MVISGTMFIGGEEVRGKGPAFHATAASELRILEPAYPSATSDQLEFACALADEAFDMFACSAPYQRADLLDAIGTNILDIGDALIERCMAETGLPRGRLEGERMRAVNQLRAFASILRDGTFATTRIDPANPAREPAPKPDLRMTQVGLGPVAVFSASNFPLAFSVAGGDTAAALAAGCPVIVKAHNAHPGTSELVGRAIRDAVATMGMPAGVFSLLFAESIAIGQALVADRRISAVGFTGSRRGGLALMETAARRPIPIPVYAEMSAINPVVLMPKRLDEAAEAIAAGFVGALTMGAGQFCTSPGLIIAIGGAALDRFIAAASETVVNAPSATMLTPGILAAYQDGAKRLADHGLVTPAASGQASIAGGSPALFVTDAETFLADKSLHDEVFGSTSLVVRCSSAPEMLSVLKGLEGQLTISIHMAPEDYADVAPLLSTIQRKTGRVIANGFGTGVEVSPAMVHGGPFPATSDGRSTSVGTLAIERFLRPVCYQDMPDALLPAALRDRNPWLLKRETV